MIVNSSMGRKDPQRGWVGSEDLIEVVWEGITLDGTQKGSDRFIQSLRGDD